MKLGPIEGTKEEITGFFQDNGLQVRDYFQIPEPPIKTVWLVIPALSILPIFAALTLFESLSIGQQIFAFLVGCAAIVWLATVVQLRFKQAWAAGIVLIGGLLLMLVALGDISPIQMLNELKSLR
jgi:asparagine N-glycosylation enzyme membrane subunit Stt3